MESQGAIVVAREKAHARSFYWRDYEAYLSGCNLPEGSRASFLNLRVWRKIFERKHVMGGKAKDRLSGEGPGEFASAEDGGMKSLGGLIVGDDDDTRNAGSADEERQVQRPGCESEAGDTSTTRASAQMAAYTLKCVGVFQVRQELADERKNHAGLILVDVRFSGFAQLE
jgi:hypothetical protein